MGKGHKDRRREMRARELEEQTKDERVLRDEFENEIQEKKISNPPVPVEKTIEASSDTDSGHGSSIITSTNSPKISKTKDQEEIKTDRHSLIKGLYNIGNTCFFNVVIQALAHTPLLVQLMCAELEETTETKFWSTTTAQLRTIFNEFASTERKKSSVDPKPLFNSLIQKIPVYKGYGQHDSHELFMNLMLILRAEEIQQNKLQSKRNILDTDDDNPSKMFCLIGCNEPHTTFDAIFGGHLLDVLTCKQCGKSLMRIEPFLGLLLPLTDRMSTFDNRRGRRKRDEHVTTKAKKEPKILSRKQQKALKKQEKKNSRRSTTAVANKLKGRHPPKKQTVLEQLPIEESAPIEESTPIEETTPVITSTEDDACPTPLPSVEQTETDNAVDNPAEEETGATVADKDDDDDDDEKEEEEEEKADNSDDEELTLTAVESICVLADMTSKLTLIHETESRPLPFVDASLAQQFLRSNITTNPSSTDLNTTDDIRTLEHCFQRFFTPETLTGENLFDCYHCRSLSHGQKKVLTEAVRQSIFFQLPPVLPIFLKRFQVHGTYSDKIDKHIEFPLELDLTDRCSARIMPRNSIYSLYAVIEHSGSLRNGHYTTYIKQTVGNDNLQFEKTCCSQPIDRLLNNLFTTSTEQYQTENINKTVDPSCPPPSWYHISDTMIHKVPESKVLEAQAYVLFYRRT